MLWNYREVLEEEEEEEEDEEGERTARVFFYLTSSVFPCSDLSTVAQELLRELPWSVCLSPFVCLSVLPVVSLFHLAFVRLSLLFVSISCVCFIKFPGACDFSLVSFFLSSDSFLDLCTIYCFLRLIFRYVYCV